MGVWFKTKCVVLIDGVYFNGVKFAVLSLQRSRLFVSKLEVSFCFAVRDKSTLVGSPSKIPRRIANIFHELILSKIKDRIADLEH